jgi:hypothetical protein
MPKFLADEHFDGKVFREITRLIPNLAIVRVQDVQLLGAKDEFILEWAASHGYVLLTHDAKTMTRHGRERMARNSGFPRMVVVRRQTSIGRMIRELEILMECTREDEWENTIWFVPLPGKWKQLF